MKEYKFSEENAKRIVKSRTIYRIPIMIIAVLAGLFIADTRTGGAIFDNTLVLVLTMFIGLSALAFGLIFGIKNGTSSLLRSTYLLSDNGVEWKTPSGKTIHIDFDKVEKHQKFNKGLLIKAQNKRIIISSELDNYDELSNIVLSKLNGGSIKI